METKDSWDNSSFITQMVSFTFTIKKVWESLWLTSPPLNFVFCNAYEHTEFDFLLTQRHVGEDKNKTNLQIRNLQSTHWYPNLPSLRSTEILKKLLQSNKYKVHRDLIPTYFGIDKWNRTHFILVHKNYFWNYQATTASWSFLYNASINNTNR